ncbi:MAG: hypothetical protein AAGF53_19640, partial [Pseudomonadota bacterium]
RFPDRYLHRGFLCSGVRDYFGPNSLPRASQDRVTELVERTLTITPDIRAVCSIGQFGLTPDI